MNLFIIMSKREVIIFELIIGLRSGKDVYLMSDCGLPAFCDPGVRLVNDVMNEDSGHFR